MLTPKDADVPPPDDEIPPTTVATPTPPPAASTRGGKRRRLRRALAIVATLVLVGSIAGAALVPLPYYAFRPGSVRDTEPLISVGSGAETYPSDGSISYTTVSLRQATLFGLLQGWISDDIEIHPADEVLGNRDADENRTFNLALMDNSKNVATQVALEHLGYDVPVSSTGATVLDVQPDSPADGVLEPGDTIVAAGGEPLDEPDDLTRIMDDDGPGDRLTVTVESQDGARRRETMRLVAAPDDPGQGIMGVLVQPRDLEYDFPVDVDIETGDVGGPSAGLAFTLGILDDLTPGELTGGEPVAVTGEILPDGTVGPVGGTGQKAAAVRAAGIHTFLVPSADYNDAIAHAGDVDVVKVDTLDDALHALADLGGNALDLPQVGDDGSAGGT